MFSSTGLFKNIQCPVEDECDLPNCIFLHVAKPNSSKEPIVRVTNARDRSVADVTPDESQSSRQGVLGKDSKPFHGSLLTVPSTKTDFAGQNASGTRSQELGASSSHQAASEATGSRNGQAVLNGRGTGPSAHGEKMEALNPRIVPNPPAQFNKRWLYIKKLEEFMRSLNEQMKCHTDPETRALAFTDAQLRKSALDQEEDFARKEKLIYENVIKMRMHKYKKMSLEEFKMSRQEQRMENESQYKDANKNQTPRDRPIDTGLSDTQELEVLRTLFIRQDRLGKFGYMTVRPSEDEITTARAGVEAAKNWETCDRCGAHFPVFPDRRLEDGALSDRGPCRHHFGKLEKSMPRSAEEKYKVMNGPPAVRHYSCCRQEIGTSGCTTADSHVFKVHDVKRLASVLQWEDTPENPAAGIDRAVVFDCEMCFTVMGMELIRLTALSWPKGEALLDVLVKPIGPILDLNTRFSGVGAEEYIQAVNYNMQSSQVGGGEGANGRSVLKPSIPLVESPREARRLLFGLINPSTPLIGHAIENDLNAVRIIHPCVIDTVLLYPHSVGLPYRRSLKSLAKEYLSRDIQMESATGHDSHEDAKATGDLAREKVKRKWQEMAREGWSIGEDGKLQPARIMQVAGRGEAKARRKRGTDALEDSGVDMECKERRS